MPTIPRSDPDVDTTPGPQFAGAVLRRLVTTQIIPSDAWEGLATEERDKIAALGTLDSLSEALVTKRLLTPFQAARVRAGAVNGLLLGNYRVLEKLGSGGMGVVFRAEHVKLRTPVAVKALFVDGVKNRRSIERFFIEVRAVATLSIPTSSRR
jgi:putative two-component system response regulator